MVDLIALVHSWWTVALLVTFVGIVVWVFVLKSKEDFDEAARAPLDDDDAPRERHR